MATQPRVPLLSSLTVMSVSVPLALFAPGTTVAHCPATVIDRPARPAAAAIARLPTGVVGAGADVVGATVVAGAGVVVVVVVVVAVASSESPRET
ncbi:hypothetical protein GS931_15325 [Rhodococcus hoagii]|nr:hypothetical protein [Prescottella equi]